LAERRVALCICSVSCADEPSPQTFRATHRRSFDAALFRSRLAVTVDYYYKKTRDLLYYVPVPTTSGFSTSLQNIGSLQNRGVELSVSTANLTGAFGWQTTLNLALNRNRVLDLGPDSIVVGAYCCVGGGAHQNPTVLKVGEPINSFYGWVYDRLAPDSLGNLRPVYKDLDGDGKDSPGDRRILGNAEPKCSATNSQASSCSTRWLARPRFSTRISRANSSCFRSFGSRPALLNVGSRSACVSPNNIDNTKNVCAGAGVNFMIYLAR